MTCEDNTALLTTIAASGLLIVSEILPYLSQVKGNGILGVILEVVRKVVAQQPNPVQPSPDATVNNTPVSTNV